MAEPKWPVTALVALWGSEHQSPAGVPPRAGILDVPLDMRFFSERRRIADLAIKHQLPSFHGVSEYVEVGGLLSYGPRLLRSLPACRRLRGQDPEGRQAR